jgi:hypothetical protein
VTQIDTIRAEALQSLLGEKPASRTTKTSCNETWPRNGVLEFTATKKNNAVYKQQTYGFKQTNSLNLANGHINQDVHDINGIWNCINFSIFVWVKIEAQTWSNMQIVRVYQSGSPSSTLIALRSQRLKMAKDG